IAASCSLHAIMDRLQPLRIGVESKNLTLVLHACGTGKRLATGASAEIQHLHARCRPREFRNDLRSFVLHLEPTFLEGRRALQVRVPAVAIYGWDADAVVGDPGRFCPVRFKRLQNLTTR